MLDDFSDANLPFSPWWVKSKRTIAWVYVRTLQVVAYGLLLDWCREAVVPTFRPWELLKGIAGGILLRLAAQSEAERLLGDKKRS